jgi:predicted nucleotide-binding protein (sugar kinase/HSP70/actin superfamily)
MLATEHYKRPVERPFTAAERSTTTILFGNLTPKHEAFIRAVFERSGYKCVNLPLPTRRAHETGKEFCNNGLCNPNYFTAGNLIEYLRGVECDQRLTKQEIVGQYVYYTAGGCGPCRFGMYESEYRQALDNAGFKGFRVLTFNSNKVIFQGSEEPGLKYTLDFGIGMFNALNVGDALFDMAHAIRAYETNPGDTDRILGEALTDLQRFVATRPLHELKDVLPDWCRDWIQARKAARIPLSVLHKIREHLYGKDWLEAIVAAREKIARIEVDRTKPKPLVKITGEFFSAISESEANYNMFAFLESEGAEVAVEPISALVLYWLRQARLHHWRKRGLQFPHPGARPWQLKKVLANELSYRKKDWMLAASERFWWWQYHRYVDLLGGQAHHLIQQSELTELAAEHYHPLARGGEGYLEVGKSLFVNRHRYAHLVLSLKPFGCMPSTQSDGVMAGVMARYPGLLFLPIETSGEGEINAHSRVQMALGDARRRAREEFESAVASTGRTIEEIRSYVQEHPQLRSAMYHFPRRKGIAGTSAQFVLHVAGLMRGGRR